VTVVGEAGDGAEAVALAVELQPDVVVMDLHMPGVNGVEATRQVVAQVPGCGVLVLTMLEGDESVAAALRAGARGYLLKGTGRAEIGAALAAVAAGATYLGPGASLSALTAPGQARVASPSFPTLSAREVEVLALVARGLSNAAIASRLVLSDKTVRNHVSNVLTKIGASDRAAAVAAARDAGLV